jgi:hypothetical protein
MAYYSKLEKLFSNTWKRINVKFNYLKMNRVKIIPAIVFLFLNFNLYSNNFKYIEKGNNYENNTKDIKFKKANSLFSSLPSLSGLKSQVESYPSKALYLNLSPNYSRLYNKNVYNDEFWQAKGGLGYNIEFGFFMKIQRLLSLGIGLGISSYQTEIKIDSYEVIFPSIIDIDGDTLDKYIQTTDLFEKTEITYCDIPIYLEFGNPNIEKINFYGRLGFKISFPISNKFTSNGKLYTQGYYPEYHVLLYSIPQLGFYDSEPIVKSEDNSLNSINVSALISSGITIPVSNYFILKLGANINLGLLEISEDKNEFYDATKYIGDYNSLLVNPHNKTTTQSFGIEFGLIYILQSKF